MFYAWADPVGSRKLKWSCGKSHGEVTQKDVSIRLTIMVLFVAFLFLLKVLFFNLAYFKGCFVATLLRKLPKI